MGQAPLSVNKTKICGFTGVFFNLAERAIKLIVNTIKKWTVRYVGPWRGLRLDSGSLHHRLPCPSNSSETFAPRPLPHKALPPTTASDSGQFIGYPIG